MSAVRGRLIKSAGAGNFPTIMEAVASPGPVELVEEATPPQKSETDELREMLAVRDAEIARHAEAVKAAYAEGEEAGRFAAVEEFEESRDQALAMLSSAIVDARTDLSNALAGFEDLATQVALEALQILVADAGDYRKLLATAIAQRVAALASESIIAITVSRMDFPDSRELADLEAQLGSPKASLKLSDDMEAGCCQIALKVGSLEFDLNRSWNEIADILSTRTNRDQGE